VVNTGNWSMGIYILKTVTVNTQYLGLYVMNHSTLSGTEETSRNGCYHSVQNLRAPVSYMKTLRLKYTKV
jgi:hypothetical protein